MDTAGDVHLWSCMVQNPPLGPGQSTMQLQRGPDTARAFSLSQPAGFVLGRHLCSFLPEAETEELSNIQANPKLEDILRSSRDGWSSAMLGAMAENEEHMAENDSSSKELLDEILNGTSPWREASHVCARLERESLDNEVIGDKE
ncbi:hypothetical protein TREMEDRAFT_64436 [Tremella mesenterica DSM 1558]|uniref:uncharacterized protein n=1 Tax=Tremella mesenterica (strain ATCC 24925 / CBS 8224 / DSM 1558 / NBRC 9311 / NRRL Y-6157 / RJB 2259-6 / UBC 559-6) TaxID=578456 RepID=UPI0003F4989D|nr:uncharacterized protein TREMEDRAFT_64436 [Tremella mesenterica DSM 1558]EIW67196.1 hypothetical protein TREMEDRAFT_64436 [Tremella mesenterica DSM 1558]